MIALLVVSEAWARLGGGEGWGGGGGGGGGGRGHGVGFDGGDGGELWLLLQLLRIAIEYPALGVPLLVATGVFFLWRVRSAGPTTPWRHERRGERWQPARATRAALSLRDDPGFSEVVLLDLASLIHRRALAARGADFDALTPWVGPEARAGLARFDGASDVVVGAARLAALRTERGVNEARVVMATSFRQSGRHEVADFVWTLRRPVGVTSVEPARLLTLSCPSCASPVLTDRMGRCTACGVAIGGGEATWRASGVTVQGLRAAPGPSLARSGGEEAGYRTRLAPAADLGPAWRRLMARSPDCTESNLLRRCTDVFQRAQTAWSSGRLVAVRPFVTDAMYQRLRFQAEPWAAAGLRNELRAVEVHRAEVLAVSRDAWYDVVSVRLWAACVDVVVDVDGRVVSGDAVAARRFSEVWTMLRSAGGKTGSDPDACPSCAAPVDNIGETGVCDHCDAIVTTGDFDWVLSRIDQADAWGDARG